jgi:predicted RNA-binding Zn-ribbon protein involved in translation (DUF1610 family)
LGKISSASSVVEGRTHRMKLKKNLRHAKIALRACPRCHGDLFPDEYEEDFACLQCGRRLTIAAVAEIMRERLEERELVSAA